MFTNLLASPAGRQVINNTGLHGRYDIDLRYAPDAADTSGLSIFMAIQEQLGLKLEPTRAPLEVVVIDHIEHPSAN
jgi:uncharacterized protein (TIGR03435 family)